MRFVLCDDHRLFIEPFAAALASRGHEVIVTTTPDAAIRAVETHRPDMCVIDLAFPQGSGIEAVQILRRRAPQCPVVVLSGSTDVHDMAAAASAGAAGFLRKDQPAATLFAAFDRIAAGRSVPTVPLPRTPPGSAEHVRVRKLLGHLTEREREVLHRLVVAEDTVGIARSLGVAPSTARTHLQNVLLKLGVHNRLQAVALVVGAGMDDEL